MSVKVSKCQYKSYDFCDKVIMAEKNGVKRSKTEFYRVGVCDKIIMGKKMRLNETK